MLAVCEQINNNKSSQKYFPKQVLLTRTEEKNHRINHKKAGPIIFWIPRYRLKHHRHNPSEVKETNLKLPLTQLLQKNRKWREKSYLSTNVVTSCWWGRKFFQEICMSSQGEPCSYTFRHLSTRNRRGHSSSQMQLHTPEQKLTVKHNKNVKSMHGNTNSLPNIF